MSVIPTLHMLEDHVSFVFIGWSMVNKGLKPEGIHSEFKLQAEHFDHVKKEEVRLRQIIVNRPPHCDQSNTGRKGSQTKRAKLKAESKCVHL